MDLLSQIVARAKSNKQRIVLPEATEERTLRAADWALADDIADIILLGNVDEVNKLGGVMSNDAVKASADFQDNLTALNTGISGLKRGITSEFLPGVNDIISGFTALITGEDTAEEQLLSGFDMILKSVDNVVPRIVSSERCSL